MVLLSFCFTSWKPWKPSIQNDNFHTLHGAGVLVCSPKVQNKVRQKQLLFSWEIGWGKSRWKTLQIWTHFIQTAEGLSWSTLSNMSFVLKRVFVLWKTSYAVSVTKMNQPKLPNHKAGVGLVRTTLHWHQPSLMQWITVTVQVQGGTGSYQKLDSPLYFNEVVGRRRMLTKLTSIVDNTSHPLHNTVAAVIIKHQLHHHR